MAELPTFPLIVHDDERSVLRTALEVYRDDFGHDEQAIVLLVDEVIAAVPDNEHLPLDLDAAAMKVTHAALRSHLETSGDRDHVRALLDRMPGEHDIRAIDLDTELKRRRAGG